MERALHLVHRRSSSTLNSTRNHSRYLLRRRPLGSSKNVPQGHRRAVELAPVSLCVSQGLCVSLYDHRRFLVARGQRWSSNSLPSPSQSFSSPPLPPRHLILDISFLCRTRSTGARNDQPPAPLPVQQTCALPSSFSLDCTPSTPIPSSPALPIFLRSRRRARIASSKHGILQSQWTSVLFLSTCVLRSALSPIPGPPWAGSSCNSRLDDRKVRPLQQPPPLRPSRLYQQVDLWEQVFRPG